jgi:type IV pilus assembly protein PilM
MTTIRRWGAAWPAAKTVVGLDIGAMSIRAVEAQRGRNGVGVTAFGQVELAPGVVRGGVIQEDQAVSAALRQLWSSVRFRGKDVVLGVTNRQVVVREMSVSNMPERERRKALATQVRDVLPLPVEQSVLDFYPLEPPGPGATIRGLLIAAPKEPVLTAVRAAERAGLRVAGVDLASFALLRAACRLDAVVEAIADIGTHATSVVVHCSGEPLIVRTIPRGGQEITEMVARRLGVEAGEAETIKCQLGLRDNTTAETIEVIKDAVRPLINEIRSSFAYLTSGGQRTQVARLSLTGGGALLTGLANALNDQLGVETVIADPLSRLRGAGGQQNEALERGRSSAAVAIGLSLGALR